MRRRLRLRVLAGALLLETSALAWLVTVGNSQLAANLSYSRGEYRAAERAMRLVALLTPWGTHGDAGIAQCLVAQGRAKEALPLARRASETMPMSAARSRILLSARVAGGPPGDAIAACQEALRRGDTDPSIRLALGDAYWRERSYEQAAHHYQ